MSDSDSDFGEVDFVSSATNTVNSKWSRQNLSNMRDSIKLSDEDAGDSDAGNNSDSNLGNKENIAEKRKIDVTPPSSPRADQVLSKGRKPKAVRGAARTKKTAQALKKMSRTSDTITITSSKLSQQSASDCFSSSSKSEDMQIVDEASSHYSKFNQVVEIKVMFKTNVTRLQVGVHERMGDIMDRFAEGIKLKAGDIRFLRSREQRDDNEHWVSRDETLSSMSFNLFSIFVARTRDVETLHDDDLIELKVQTKGGRSSDLVTIRKMEPMKVLMKKFCDVKLWKLSDLKFFFDGDLISPEDTPESLEFEGGECIDVFQLHVA